jgi:hypothetical protein
MMARRENKTKGYYTEYSFVKKVETGPERHKKPMEFATEDEANEKGE